MACLYKYLKLLDSRFRGNDTKGKIPLYPPLLKGEVRKLPSSLIPPPLKTCPRENREGGARGDFLYSSFVI